MSDTKTTLIAALDKQRGHVIEALDGLDPAAMQRATLPSGWTCVGLVNHLTLDVEQFWFGNVMAAEPFDADREDGWHVDANLSGADVIAAYQRQIDHVNGIISATSLDTAPSWWPDFFGSFYFDDLQEVIIHVITETACHAGHLDAARELIDGKQSLVLS